MINSKKKGFTIVELVIVVAVIAVLAAVLIPTFSNLVKKANISADQQAVVQMNKLLAMGESVNDLPENTDDVVEVLIENGYTSDLTTYYSNYQLAWVKESNVIVLVENGAVVYPEKYEGVTVFEQLNPMIKNIEELLGSLETGKTVFVGADIETEGLNTEAAGEYNVNLNGNKLITSNYVGSWIENSKLVISNGVIDSNKDGITVLAEEGGQVELNNVQVYAPSGVNPLQCYGGTMILNNVIASQSGSVSNGATWYNSVIQVINQIKQVEGKWTIYGPQANLIVEGGMYSGKKAIQISAPGGNVTINGGNFVGSEQVINADFAPNNYGNSSTYESVITINGGNFEGLIKISAATKLVINGGTFTINPSEITKGLVTINGNVVDNGNGTWTVK